MNELTPERLAELKMPQIFGGYTPVGPMEMQELFDHIEALTAKLSEARAQALRDAANELELNPVEDDQSLLMRVLLPSCNNFAKVWLRARADQIDAEGN